MLTLGQPKSAYVAERPDILLQKQGIEHVDTLSSF